MTAKHSPATSLPWDGPVNYGVSKFEVQGPHSRLATVDKLPDAAYIVHAANAYPKLVEALRGIVEQVECMNAQGAFGADYDTARALLRELGEAE